MAFFVTSRVLMRKFIKSELIFKNIVKTHSLSSNVGDKYIADLKEMKIDPNVIAISEYLEFPIRTFYKVDKKSFEYIIHNSYDVFKQKGLITTPEAYKSILKTYLYDRIDFDMENLLKDMAESKITKDQEIYNYIIRFYCNNRQMDVVEKLLEELKDKGIEIDRLIKFIIISSYIYARQPDKCEQFIRENQIELDSFDLLFSKCFGYACLGDVDKLKSYLFEMNEKNMLLTAYHCKLLYSRLLHANIDKLQFDEIVDLTKKNFTNYPLELYQLVSRLNTENNFQTSIYLISKLIDVIDNPVVFISLFSSPRCPIDIFTEVLELLIDLPGRCSRYTNIFMGVTFDSAFEISQKFRFAKNWKAIYYSLINKAINEKSVPLIEKVLSFSYSYLQWFQINLMLQESLIRLMLEDGIVSNYEDILDIMPRYKKELLPVILMEYLCTGEFNRCDHLKGRITESSCILSVKGNAIPHLLLKNFSSKDIKGWAKEAQKYFQRSLINQILTDLIVLKVVFLSKNYSLDEVENFFGCVKEWNVKISQGKLDFLLKVIPDHAELIHSSMATNFNGFKSNMKF